MQGVGEMGVVCVWGGGGGGGGRVCVHVRAKEKRESWEWDIWGGESMYACESKRGAERKGERERERKGGMCTCVCVCLRTFARACVSVCTHFSEVVIIT